MKKIFFVFVLVSFLGCSHKGQELLPAQQSPVKIETEGHVCGEILEFQVSAHLMPSTTYKVPAHCFVPHVKNDDVAVENQKRKLLLKIIGVMEARPEHKTGAEMLDYCWENLWKWDHLPEDQRPSHFPAVCAIPATIAREDVETVKIIERCRLECLSNSR